MKRSVIFICFLIFQASLFARTVITTENNPYITEDDVIEAFIEELNKPRWAYVLYDYEIYNTQEKQALPWSVEISDCSYFDDYNEVKGEQVILNISNGYFVVKTFGGETTESTIANGIQKAIDVNDIDSYEKYYDEIIFALKQFALKSYKWEKVYDKDSVKYEKISKLCFIDWDLWTGFITTDYILSLWGETYYYAENQYDLSFASNIDFLDFLGEDFNNNFMARISRLCNKTLYSVTGAYDFSKNNLPEEYSKVLHQIICRDVYDIETEKRYVYLELRILNKNNDWSNFNENTDLNNFLESKYLELEYPIFFEDPFGEDLIKEICDLLGDEVYCENYFNDYNLSLEESLK